MNELDRFKPLVAVVPMTTDKFMNDPSHIQLFRSPVEVLQFIFWYQIKAGAYSIQN